MDGGAWWAAVHGVAKSRTRLSDFTFTFHFHKLGKEMATHSLQSCPTLGNPIDGSPPGSPVLGFSRQERWSGYCNMNEPQKYSKGKKPKPNQHILYDSTHMK